MPTETPLSTIKQKILKTDSVIKLLAEKNHANGKLKQNYEELSVKYRENLISCVKWKKEAKQYNIELSDIKLRYNKISNNYELLESKYNTYYNDSQLKFEALEHACKDSEKYLSDILRLELKIESLQDELPINKKQHNGKTEKLDLCYEDKNINSNLKITDANITSYNNSLPSLIDQNELDGTLINNDFLDTVGMQLMKKEACNISTQTDIIICQNSSVQTEIIPGTVDAGVQSKNFHKQTMNHSVQTSTDVQCVSVQTDYSTPIKTINNCLKFLEDCTKIQKKDIELDIENMATDISYNPHNSSNDMNLSKNEEVDFYGFSTEEIFMDECRYSCLVKDFIPSDNLIDYIQNKVKTGSHMLSPIKSPPLQQNILYDMNESSTIFMQTEDVLSKLPKQLTMNNTRTELNMKTTSSIFTQTKDVPRKLPKQLIMKDTQTELNMGNIQEMLSKPYMCSKDTQTPICTEQVVETKTSQLQELKHKIGNNFTQTTIIKTKGNEVFNLGHKRKRFIKFHEAVNVIKKLGLNVVINNGKVFKLKPKQKNDYITNIANKVVQQLKPELNTIKCNYDYLKEKFTCISEQKDNMPLTPYYSDYCEQRSVDSGCIISDNELCEIASKSSETSSVMGMDHRVASGNHDGSFQYNTYKEPSSSLHEAIIRKTPSKRKLDVKSDNSYKKSKLELFGSDSESETGDTNTYSKTKTQFKRPVSKLRRTLNRLCLPKSKIALVTKTKPLTKINTKISLERCSNTFRMESKPSIQNLEISPITYRNVFGLQNTMDTKLEKDPMCMDTSNHYRNVKSISTQHSKLPINSSNTPTSVKGIKNFELSVDVIKDKYEEFSKKRIAHEIKLTSDNKLQSFPDTNINKSESKVSNTNLCDRAFNITKPKVFKLTKSNNISAVNLLKQFGTEKSSCTAKIEPCEKVTKNIEEDCSKKSILEAFNIQDTINTLQKPTRIFKRPCDTSIKSSICPEIKTDLSSICKKSILEAFNIQDTMDTLQKPIKIFKRPACDTSIKTSICPEIKSELSSISKLKPQNKYGKKLDQMIAYPTNEMHCENAVNSFKLLETYDIVTIVLKKVLLDNNQEATKGESPFQPLLSEPAKIMFGFMVKLENDHVPGLLECYLQVSEDHLLTEKEPTNIECITRLYVAVCKYKKQKRRLQKMLWDSLYFMGKCSVPFIYYILINWIEVLPRNANFENKPLLKVLNNFINTIDCKDPIYNLLPVRGLLRQYFQFPDYEYFDKLIKDLIQDYLCTLGKTYEIAILILCKNCSNKTKVYKQIQLLQELVTISKDEDTVKGLIILTSNIAGQFNYEEDACMIKNVELWLQTIKSDLPNFNLQETILDATKRLPLQY